VEAGEEAREEGSGPGPGQEACEEGARPGQEEERAGEEEEERPGKEEGQAGQEGWQEEGREEKALALRQFGVEPGARDRPVALHGPRRNSEYFGRLFFREAAEVPELHDAHLARVDGAQAIEGLADGEHFVVRLGEVVSRHVVL